LSGLPLLDFKELSRLLLVLGFEPKRQKGSHVFFRNPDGRTTTVPNHPGRPLAKPLLREILREINISIDEFNELLKQK
jgi:predicted RNA binding protein YcfA (HicA-like mRNA interferase family)